jgi:hypothetical protein
METEFEDRKIRIFNNMAEYVNGNRMMYMDIETYNELKTPFILGMFPVKDCAFETFEDDVIIYDGRPYVRVDMCESDYVDTPAYLLHDALEEEVFQIYVKVPEKTGVYEADNRAFKTKEEAEFFMETYYK